MAEFKKMNTKYEMIKGASNNVFKYVITLEDGAVAEAVLYRYPDFNTRTVLCISTQSGCPCGCIFCGTGKTFIRNLYAAEIINQVRDIFHRQMINANKINKLQIMFMSMGEPLLNWKNVRSAIELLSLLYPNADLLLSTIAPDNAVLNSVIELASEIDKVGLQFSLHASIDKKRDEIIPFKNKCNIAKIEQYGQQFYHVTGRCPYLNICVDDSFDMSDVLCIRKQFNPGFFCITLSVICSPNESLKDAGYRNLENIRYYERAFTELGYNTRVFNPEGQDDIGGGCGQLWHFQKSIKE